MEQKLPHVGNALYKFNLYVEKNRWISFWHQIDEVIKLNPTNVLEIGVGPGIFKDIIIKSGIQVSTVDINPDLGPDYVASATNLPFENDSFDCVCAFQMLEHLPYNETLLALSEMVRVSKKNIVISIPNSKKVWYNSLQIPLIGRFNLHIPIPFKQRIIDKEHFWEINKKGYSLKRILSDFSSLNLKLVQSFRVNENPYHHFFCLEKNTI